jgi:hypothetical protein
MDYIRLVASASRLREEDLTQRVAVMSLYVEWESPGYKCQIH